MVAVISDYTLRLEGIEAENNVDDECYPDSIAKKGKEIGEVHKGTKTSNSHHQEGKRSYH